MEVEQRAKSQVFPLLKKNDTFQLFTRPQIAAKQPTVSCPRGDCEKLINSRVCQVVTPTESPAL